MNTTNTQTAVSNFQKGFAVFFASLMAWILLIGFADSEVKTLTIPMIVGGGVLCFAPTITLFACMYLNRKATTEPKGARFICELKANGNQFMAVKDGRGYRYIPYDGSEPKGVWCWLSSVEFHNTFNTIDRPSRPYVSRERMSRMGLN